jgi:hypothetical protein
MRHANCYEHDVPHTRNLQAVQSQRQQTAASSVSENCTVQYVDACDTPIVMSMMYPTLATCKQCDHKNNRQQAAGSARAPLPVNQPPIQLAIAVRHLVTHTDSPKSLKSIWKSRMFWPHRRHCCTHLQLVCWPTDGPCSSPLPCDI